MFLGGRLPIVRRFILATTPAEEEAALGELLVAQRTDFAGILEAMDGLPVTVRLLDPPLHEFLPAEHEIVAALRASSGEDTARLRRTLRAVRDLAESNPMLGLRGCRLGLTRPGVYEMQTRALAEAALARLDVGGEPRLEIMIPLVSVRPELDLLRAAVEKAVHAADPEGRLDVKVGTMIETPRAALVADDIAGSADFFSFGTNDLTQMTFAFSRDDAEGKFLPAYLEREILERNPFETIDQAGVGRLVEMGTRLGREANAELKIGVCGEHGGDPASIAFFHRAGLDYVSCSPFRVPAARLAAAQAALAESGSS
jgi:pyruvate,orthophosphate dikinase